MSSKATVGAMGGVVRLLWALAMIVGFAVSQERSENRVDEETVTRIHQVRVLLRDFRDRYPYRLGIARRDESESREAFGGGGEKEEGRPAMTATALVDLLRMATARKEIGEPSVWEAEGNKVEVEDTGLLVVQAPDSVQQRVLAVLRQLEELSADDHVLELHVVRAADLGGMPTIGPIDAMDRRLLQIGMHPRFLRPIGRPEKIDWSGSRAIRTTMDGLLPSCRPSMAAVGPVVADAADGSCFYTSVNRGRQSDYILHTVYTSVTAIGASLPRGVGLAERLGKVSQAGFDMDLRSEAVVQLDQICYLNRGQAVVSASSERDDVAVVVMVRSGERKAESLQLLECQPSGLGLRLFPVADFVLKCNRSVQSYLGLEGTVWMPEVEADKPAVFDETKLGDIIKNTIAPDRFADGSFQVQVIQESAMLAVLADEPTLAAVERLLDGLEPLSGRQFEIDLRCGVVTNEVACASGVQPWETILRTRVRGVAFPSRGLHASMVTMTPYVRDYKLTVDEDAMAATPEIQSAAAGIDVVVRVMPTNGSKVQLLVDMCRTELIGAFDKETVQTPYGPIHLPRLEQTSLHPELRVDLDTWTLLDLRPQSDGKSHFAVAARVTELPRK